MKKLICWGWGCYCLLFFFTQNLYSQVDKNTIEIANLKKHLEYIASDELEGRYAGSKGIQKAAEYIKNQLFDYGIRSFTSLNGYEQEMSLFTFNVNPKNTFIALSDFSGSEKYKNDTCAFLTPQYYDTIIGDELVFIGYGYKDKETNYNDLEGVDINNKIVLMMSGTPKSEVTSEALNLGFDSEIESRKVENIVLKGAKTILFVTSPATREYVNYDIKLLNSIIGFGMQLDSKKPVMNDFQMIAISENMADRIVQHKGYANLQEIENKILKQNKPHSFNLDSIKLSIHIDIDQTEYRDRNIIGYIEGSDPKLKNEFIVFCAHYDHDGKDKQGNILNGADDNGSGTVGILEIAKAFSQLDRKPRRSIIFAWFTAEERGLLGSEFYTHNPLISFENVVTCLNLDMIGRTKLPSDTIPTKGYGKITVKENDTIYVVTGNKSKQLIKINEKSCKKYNIVPDYSMHSFLGYSDQYHFYNKGVPVIFFHSGLHSDYHRTGDDADKINYKYMQRICKIAFSTGYKVANRKQRIRIEE